MHDELIKDLEDRTGLTIDEIEIGDIDFIKDSTTIKIKYKI